jgi:hypothetical protein
MSCLYSSPDVKNLEAKSLEAKSLGFSLGFSPPSPRRPVRRASSAPNHSAVQFHRDLPYVAISKDAFPTAQASAGDRINRLAKQAQVSCVSIQAQYQAFVRFAVRSSAALSAIALDWTCVLEPFTRGGLSL